MDKKITIGNVCFIQDKDQGKVLLLRRNKSPMKNLYAGVGGKTDFEEDIHQSCLREVYEETGLIPTNLCLKGVLKTLIQTEASSWILFVYTAECKESEPIECDEGVLEWVFLHDLSSRNLIGFIRKILPHIFNETSFFEGTIVHDLQGDVISENIRTFQTDSSAASIANKGKQNCFDF